MSCADVLVRRKAGLTRIVLLTEAAREWWLDRITQQGLGDIVALEVCNDEITPEMQGDGLDVADSDE